MDGDGLDVVVNVGPQSFIWVGTESKEIFLFFSELIYFINCTVVERVFKVVLSF